MYLREPATLNLDPPKKPAAASSEPPAEECPSEEPPPPTPSPTQPPPQPPPLPPPIVPLGAADRTEYGHFRGRYEGDPPKFQWIDCDIPGYRGPGSHDDAVYWNPRKPPCVPSDYRPAHLISSRLCAEAVCAARRLELFMPCEGKDPYDAEHDVEYYECTPTRSSSGGCTSCIRSSQTWMHAPCSRSRTRRSITRGRAHVVAGCLHSDRGLCTRRSWASVIALYG